MKRSSTPTGTQHSTSARPIDRLRRAAKAVGVVAAFSLAPAIAPVSGCATTRSAGQRADDAQLTAAVGQRLSRDPDVRRYDVDVDTLDGVVTLRGEVPDYETWRAANDVAAATPGVDILYNELVIDTEDPSDVADGDGAVTVRVVARITADPDVRVGNIDVDTVDGVVTLSGVVEDDTAAREAVAVARRTEGVDSVVDELHVARR